MTMNKTDALVERLRARTVMVFVGRLGHEEPDPLSQEAADAIERIAAAGREVVKRARVYPPSIPVTTTMAINDLDAVINEALERTP